jgi:hypothetical protein
MHIIDDAVSHMGSYRKEFETLSGSRALRNATQVGARDSSSNAR